LEREEEGRDHDAANESQQPKGRRKNDSQAGRAGSSIFFYFVFLVSPKGVRDGRHKRERERQITEKRWSIN